MARGTRTQMMVIKCSMMITLVIYLVLEILPVSTRCGPQHTGPVLHQCLASLLPVVMTPTLGRNRYCVGEEKSDTKTQLFLA